MTLRARLSLLLALLSAGPPVLLAWSAARLATRAQQQAAQRSAADAVEAARGRLLAVHARLERQTVWAAAAIGGGPVTPEALAHVAAVLDLDTLEVWAPDGSLVASSQFATGGGWPDAGRVLNAALGLRLVRLAQGDGFEERLASTAEAATMGGARVRGGLLVAPRVLDEIALGPAEVALAAPDGALWARPGFPLGAAAFASGSREGELPAAGSPMRWSARALGQELLLLAAVPAPASSLSDDLLRRGAAWAAGAALLGLVLASLLAASLSRPLERLSRAAQRAAAGDLSLSVPVDGPGEIAELGRSFNEMLQELRATRVSLVQAGRVAMWRDVARRLAHELKNPLFPIQISVETLRRAFEKEGAGAGGAAFRKLFEDLTATVLAELKSLRRIVEDFAGFARLPVPWLRETDLSALAQRVLDLHAARASEVRLETHWATDLPPVPADPDLLARALSNLVTNALEAMPDGGVLTVSTATRGRHAEVAVGDTGPGLDAAQRELLFQPYHTTKPSGTGLGLVIVQGIVSDHRGYVEVDSQPGRGTTFRLLLPLLAAP